MLLLLKFPLKDINCETAQFYVSYYLCSSLIVSTDGQGFFKCAAPLVNVFGIQDLQTQKGKAVQSNTFTLNKQKYNTLKCLASTRQT